MLLILFCISCNCQPVVGANGVRELRYDRTYLQPSKVAFELLAYGFKSQVQNCLFWMTVSVGVSASTVKCRNDA